jgi:hypothetical protein
MSAESPGCESGSASSEVRSPRRDGRPHRIEPDHAVASDVCGNSYAGSDSDPFAGRHRQTDRADRDATVRTDNRIDVEPGHAALEQVRDRPCNA